MKGLVKYIKTTTNGKVILQVSAVNSNRLDRLNNHGPRESKSHREHHKTFFIDASTLLCRIDSLAVLGPLQF